MGSIFLLHQFLVPHGSHDCTSRVSLQQQQTTTPAIIINHDHHLLTTHLFVWNEEEERSSVIDHHCQRTIQNLYSTIISILLSILS